MRFTAVGAATAATLLSCVAGAWSAPQSTNGPFPLKLFRPAHVGDVETARAVVSHTENMSATKDGDELHHEQKYREISCTVRTRVLAVQSGRPVKTRVYFASISGRDSFDAALTRQDLTGVTVDVTTSPNMSVARTDGKALSAGDEAYLKLLFQATDADAPDDDAVIGPSGPVRIGDSWKGDSEKIAAMLSREAKIAVAAADVTSLFLLDSRGPLSGVDCLTVRGTIDIGKMALESGADAQMTGTSGSAHITQTIVAPVDPTLPIVRTAQDMTMTITGPMNVPQVGRAELTVKETEHREVTDLPAGKH